MPVIKAKIVIVLATILVLVIGGVALREHDVSAAHRRAEARALALQRAAYTHWISGPIPTPSGQGYGQFSDP